MRAWMSILILTALVALVPFPSQADCGSVPFYAPALMSIDITPPETDAEGNTGVGSDSTVSGNKLKFDPLKVSVFEPKQRAIILWNGLEEILLLSTDQKASQPSAVLEVIPLPSKPEVSLGSFKTFEKAQQLVVNKRMWACAHGGAAADAMKIPVDAGKIHFSQKMGAHDLTVAEVLTSEGFVEFVQAHLQKKYGTEGAPIRADFVQVIRSYIDQDFKWFAFDVIKMDGSVQSREPVQYRFASDMIHYPLRISSLEAGKTEVDLLVFTNSGVHRFDGIPASEMDREPTLGVSDNELKDLNSSWAGFFGERTAVSLDQWRIEGESSRLLKDVSVK